MDNWQVLPEGVTPDALAALQRASDTAALMASMYYKSLMAREVPHDLASLLVMDFIRIQLTPAVTPKPATGSKP